MKSETCSKGACLFQNDDYLSGGKNTYSKVTNKRVKFGELYFSEK